MLGGGHRAVGREQVLLERGVDDQGRERPAGVTPEPDRLGQIVEVVGTRVEVVGVDEESLAALEAQGVQRLGGAGGGQSGDGTVGGRAQVVGERQVAVVDEVPVDVEAPSLTPGLRVCGHVRSRGQAHPAAEDAGQVVDQVRVGGVA